MTKIDEAEFKRIVSGMTGRQAPWGVNPVQRLRISKDQRAAGKLVESALTEAGLDVGKLNKMLAQDQSEFRARFRKQTDDRAKYFSATEAAYRQSIEARRKALGLLTKPFVSTFTTLDKPFLIWQLPHPELNIFINSHVESLNSSVKVLINTISGSDNTQFVFYFLWQNDSDFFAIVNATSSLVFNGPCEVDAAPGIFSGDTAFLNMSASLATMRWSGWGNDPTTGASNNQTPYPDFQQSQSKTVAALFAQGGHIFGGQGTDPKAFSFESFDLAENMILVPGRAVAVFEVALQLSYGFGDGGNISDLVSVDFANNGNSVRCPFVQLELLTAPSNVAVG